MDIFVFQIFDLIESEVMMALMTEEEVLGMIRTLEQQEIDCQTGSGTVPGIFIPVRLLMIDIIYFVSVRVL